MTAIAQRSFAGGELAPSLYARTDMSKYQSGLRTCRNFIVQRHGGVTNRSGTEYIGEVKDSSKVVRLIKYVYNASQTYVLEFGDLYMRVYKAGARVNVSGVAAWNILTTYAEGDLVSRLGVNYYSKQNNNLGIQPPDASFWYPLTGAIYEIPTPYAAADLAAIRFVQSLNTITLVHPSCAPRELRRTADTTWVLSTILFRPALNGPLTLGLAGGAAGGSLFWIVTAIADETFEEGQESGINAGNRVPSAGTPTTVSWTAPAGTIKRYNIYRGTDGASYGYIGSATGLSFSDIGTAPDYSHPNPGNSRTIFDATAKYPSAVAYYQQRRVFANSNTNPETVWGSRTALPNNFNTTFPLQDDDAVTLTLVGQQMNGIQHLLDLGRLIIFTSAEEKMVEGDQAGILRPDAVNPRKLSANGSGMLRPLEVGDSAIYTQARGTLIRDFKPISADSYEGTDLTVFAAHLFTGYTIADWDFALNPNSIVWAVRSDGILLGLTYLRDHAIWGWHRHDTDGVVENICVVPEGSEDRVYVVVRRVINGSTKRYVERFASRFFTDQEDAVFMDAAASYDGWNVAATTITLSGGVNWTSEELLTATASAGTFVAGDVGNVVILRILDTDGNETDRVRLTISSYTSATVVKGFVDKTVPSGLRSAAKTTWALAKKTVTGLSHLEGKPVSVLGDGYVVASPNNEDYPAVVVTAGVATLPAPYAVIHVGLPYISDLVTLDLDGAGQSTIKDRKVLVNRLGVYVEGSRGIWAGMPDQPTNDDPLNGLQEYKARSEEDYADPVTPKTDFIDINIEARWDTNGRQMIRQVDPLPLTVLSITPIGYL